jgi:hypothetical protein
LSGVHGVHTIIGVASISQAPFDSLIMPLSEMPFLPAATSSRLPSPENRRAASGIQPMEET